MKSKKPSKTVVKAITLSVFTERDTRGNYLSVMFLNPKSGESLIFNVEPGKEGMRAKDWTVTGSGGFSDTACDSPMFILDQVLDWFHCKNKSEFKFHTIPF